MISESPVAAVFGANPPGDENASLVHQARAMIRAGYAVVLCKPGTKIPMCTLNSIEVKRADEEAQESARAAGHRRWDKVRHPCGLKHALTDEKTSDRVIKRLVKSHGRINLGIELRQSRVVIVDVDTEAEDAAFHAEWEQQTSAPLPFGMTVRSPGVFNDAEWKHKNGGHYWFTLPEGVDLPSLDGAMKMPSGWVAMWADRQVLVPPSVRPEGAYELVGDAHEIPDWLLKTILGYMLTRKERLREQAARRAQKLASGDPDATIDIWSAETPWREILEPDGWFDTGGSDRCGTGCEIWTAPGVHASTKSATAHDVGCTDAHYDDSLGHLPMHVWTTSPPDYLADNETVSKIQYVALRDFGDAGGDGIRQACRALGIAAEGNGRAPLTPLSMNNPLLAQAAAEARADPLPQPSEQSAPAPGGLQPTSLSTGAGSVTNGTNSMVPAPELSAFDKLVSEREQWYLADKAARRAVERAEEGVEDTDVAPGASWHPLDLEPYLNGTVETVKPSVGMARLDDVHLLYAGREHVILGEMESGKSWVSLACVVAELNVGNSVVYIHFEEVDPASTVERLLGFGVAGDVLKARFHFVGPEEPVTPKYLRSLTAEKPSLVVLDGVNEAMSLLDLGIRDEDGAAAYRRRLVKPFTRVGAAVLSCDHVVKSKENRDRYALGSIHKGNGLDGSIIMLENIEPFGRNQKGRSLVYVTKDRGGQLRQHGRRTELAGKTFMGVLTIDDTGDLAPILTVSGPRVTFAPPASEVDITDAESPAPAQDGGLPEGRFVPELAGYFKQLYDIHPAAGYSKTEARALFRGSVKPQAWESASKAVGRAFLKLAEAGFTVPSQDNIGQKIDGKHRWAGPGDKYESGPVEM